MHSKFPGKVVFFKELRVKFVIIATIIISEELFVSSTFVSEANTFSEDSEEGSAQHYQHTTETQQLEN